MTWCASRYGCTPRASCHLDHRLDHRRVRAFIGAAHDRAMPAGRPRPGRPAGRIALHGAPCATVCCMGNPVPDTKTPALVAFVMVVAGIAIAAVQGIVHGSIFGGVIAAAGAIPACFGMWKGIQQETQGTLALSVTAVLVSLAVGAVLIVLRVVSWLH